MRPAAVLHLTHVHGCYRRAKHTAGLAFMCAAVIGMGAGCAGDDGPGVNADFVLIAPTSRLVLERGRLTTVDFELRRSGGFDKSVTVTATMLVAGVTPGAVTVRADVQGGALQLAVESSAPLGPVDGAILLGIGGELERSAPLRLMVAEPSPSAARENGSRAQTRPVHSP